MSSIFFSESSKNIGGQELQLLQQALGLKAKGFVPRILCRPSSQIGLEAERLALAVEWVPFRNALDLRSLWRVGCLLWRYRPRAVVCHSGHDANVCALAVRVLGVLWPFQARPRLLRMRTYLTGRAKAFTYNHLFDHTYTPSHALKYELLAQAPIRDNKVSVLYPGVDFDGLMRKMAYPLPNGLLHQLQGQPQPFLIAHAAMLRAEKGHALMLKVMQVLRRHYPQVLYVIAGEGPLREALESEVLALDLQAHVCFLGMLNPVSPLLARADVVVMPSLYEPLGMSQIEALGLGVPVVVSDVGGLPETVQQGLTGYVCPSPSVPDATEAWVNTLSVVIANPAQAKQMALRGQAHVRSVFSTGQNLKKLMEVL